MNSLHEDYAAHLDEWGRARDVLAGEDAVKAAGDTYLPRLDSQTEEESLAYIQRASFFNGTARTADGYIGLLFRRPLFVNLPPSGSGVDRALSAFVGDVDMFGMMLDAYPLVNPRR